MGETYKKLANSLLWIYNLNKYSASFGGTK